MPFIEITPQVLETISGKYALQSVDALEEEIRQSLLKVIARGAKSSAKLREAMLGKDYPAELVDQLIERFQEVGLIDDFQMAKSVVDSQLSRKPMAKSTLARSLREKGFSPEAITFALQEINLDSELEAAKSLAEARIRQLLKLEPAVRQRRLVGFLTRKGYSSAVVWAAVKHAESTNGI